MSLQWELLFHCRDNLSVLPPHIFETIYAGICGLYERKLKELNPAVRNITYDISDLYNFIDGLADLSALV